MKQKYSLIVSGILTVLVIATIMGVSFLSQVLAQGSAPSSTQSVPSVPPTATTEAAQSYNDAVETYRQQAAETEQQYQSQINSLRDILQSLDTDYGTQLQSLQEKLAEANATLTALDEQAATTTASITEAKQAIQSADESYQTNLDAMVADAQQQEMAMRAEVETMYAQLQSAYDEIAARQAASAANASNSNSGGSRSSDSHHDDHDDHHDDDHGDEHDDD